MNAFFCNAHADPIQQSTIIPALLFNDIGPVLSFTGAIGASCISYIGPGLVFLGVNGEEFMNSIGEYLNRWRRERGCLTTEAYSEGDLPVDGNASLRQKVDINCTYENITSGRKPCWYYLGLFPLWVWIANRGASNIQLKIDAAISSVACDDNIDELPRPSPADFCVCIFFVLFGVVAMVAGVVSNVYVQMNNLDDV